MKSLLLFLVCSTLFVACSQSQEQATTADVQEVRDVSITESNAYSNLFLDSASLEAFIQDQNFGDARAAQLRNFYSSRNYQFAWFTDEGLAEHAKEFWNLHRNYMNYAQDSSVFDKELHTLMKDWIDEEVDAESSLIQKTELALTDHFFDYAKTAYGGKVNPKSLNWYIPKKKVRVVELLESFVGGPEKEAAGWEPLNAQYFQMRQHVQRYYSLQKNGGWNTIQTGDKKVFRQGDSATIIRQIKNRLRITGDLNSEDTSAVYTQDLYNAVLHAQRRFGLVADGVVGPATLSALNVPVEDRIRQMLLNMERMRWLPQQPQNGVHISVNIPEYALHVYEGKNKVFDIDVIVGKQGHNTQIFSDQLEYVVFSPYWNIPRSIVREEIVPAMKRDPSYLDRNNMEITGNRNGLPVIRQKPGPNNALGKVKFIFPNSYHIYFHDTPAKSLFSNNKRAFSHGCIRLEEPARLAQFVLQDKPGWDDARIYDAMNSGKEKWVKLDEKIPVLITYFTSWVDESGSVHFRKDIYDHDKRLAKQLLAE